MDYEIGDLVYATHFPTSSMGIGIVIRRLDHDVVDVYWVKDKIVLAACFDSIGKVEANESKV